MDGADEVGSGDQATWAIRELFKQATGAYPPFYGRPSGIATRARALEWPVRSSPLPGSIAVFQPGVHDADPDVGHAAWVEKVEIRGDGVYITILEMAPAAGVGWNRRTLKHIEGVEYVEIPIVKS